MRHRSARSLQEDLLGVWTIIVAGGSGIRFGERKQFAQLGDRSVLHYGVEVATSVSEGVVVVVPLDAVDRTRELLNDTGLNDSEPVGLVSVVAGGQTRAESVRQGLERVPDNASVVLVHDAARPLATSTLFARVVAEVQAGSSAVIPVVPVTDSIRHVDGHPVDRSSLLAVQTPQGFDVAALREAHASGTNATDDATLVSALGYDVVTVVGEPDNRKLTVPSDLVSAKALLATEDVEPVNQDAPSKTQKESI